MSGSTRSGPVDAQPSVLLVDRSEGVAVLRLNRPHRLNALDSSLVTALRTACASIADDPDVRVVMLTGAGRGFCSGIDIRDFGGEIPDASAPAIERLRFQEMMAALPRAVRDLPQPVVAAVNGPAVGGGLALCLAADVRICAASATFGNAAIRLGLSGAEMGMSYHLPRVVGTSVAADWMLTGRMVAADEALRSGLVSAVHADDELGEQAMRTAALIASHSPLATRMTKRALAQNTDAPSLAAAIELENRNQVITHATDEAAAARAAWGER
ncbi:enoyl-CoA hydratase/isomerase family protein [Pseudofrankia asymbiotica]|uniref:enoyl-CoA hydratase/isomerase family protein n=1 Tax=Pseudofrankia asymbiotica TaxID=1834516 RepID=UPI0018EA0CAB|nr:enoyl-CoA hydratase/isomerase family protein [Pseudofrankia asymbiotica]